MNEQKYGNIMECEFEANQNADAEEFLNWMDMMARCYNPLHPEYPNEGGKGIEVSKSFHTFKTFIKDMGHMPENLRFRPRRLVREVMKMEKCLNQTINMRWHNSTD